MKSLQNTSLVSLFFKLYKDNNNVFHVSYVKSLIQVITLSLLSSGLATAAIPVSASAQISQERLNIELAHMDLIAQCDANLNWIGDSPVDDVAKEVLASCDKAMLDIQDNCNENPEFTTCSDERIEGYLIARGVLS